MPLHLVPGQPGSGMTWEAPRNWGCLSKQSFRSRHDAIKSINRPHRSIQRHLSRGLCEPYRCDLCGSWHVGAGK